MEDMEKETEDVHGRQKSFRLVKGTPVRGFKVLGIFNSQGYDM